MRGQIVHRRVSVHAPDLEGHVVAAGGQELALRVPLDGIHLVGVALHRVGVKSKSDACSYLERFDRSVLAKLADVDLLVRGAGGKALFGLPVDIKSGGGVESKLLLAVPGCRVPDDGCPIHSS